jgi:hypothetical protein
VTLQEIHGRARRPDQRVVLSVLNQRSFKPFFAAALSSMGAVALLQASPNGGAGVGPRAHQRPVRRHDHLVRHATTQEAEL